MRYMGSDPCYPPRLRETGNMLRRLGWVVGLVCFFTAWPVHGALSGVRAGDYVWMCSYALPALLVLGGLLVIVGVHAVGLLCDTVAAAYEAQVR